MEDNPLIGLIANVSINQRINHSINDTLHDLLFKFKNNGSLQ